MEDATVKLESLVGTRVLDGVDRLTEDHDVYGSVEPCDVVLFRLDGITYKAIENPDDGYRSYMDGLIVSDDEIKNVFPPCKVIASHQKQSDSGYCEEDDILVLTDANTQKVVLEVGTNDLDDYYPCFVGRFDPTAMSSNAEV